jgi:hypothetical protein
LTRENSASLTEEDSGRKVFLFLLSCCGVYLRDALKQFGISRRKSLRPLFVLAKLSRVSNDEGQEEGAHQEDER